MVRRLTWTGSTLRPQSIETKGRLARALHQHVWPLLEAGTIRPLAHCQLPLQEAAAAHALMEASTHIGKIMLVNESHCALRWRRLLQH
jgi:NADPH2:quinone reductase